MSGKIINLAQWFDQPAGRHLRQWELERCDQAVGDLFGYNALQIGAEHLPLLRNSRMQKRWLSSQHRTALKTAQKSELSLVCDPEALPLSENSIDLVLLPHTLDTSANPHAALREVARVLVPDGRLIVMGFNPSSLWGMQQGSRHLAQGLGAKCAPFIPDVHSMIAYRRLRDWMQLLGLEIETGCFGCYRPGVHSDNCFDRLDWLESAGDRWWPHWGGVYFLQAVKRVRGVRMIQPRWKTPKPAHKSAPVMRQRKFNP